MTQLQMATNPGKRTCEGAVSKLTRMKNPRTGKWVKRDSYTGQFIAVKKTGGIFKGVKKEK